MSSDIERVKERLDILSIVQEYVPNMKASGQNYFGLCPFHKEKTPSFSVNPELGIFKCFGCGESGDVLSFLQKIEGLDFAQTLKLGAEKVGIELNSHKGFQENKNFKLKKQKALKAQKLACEFFHYVLTKHEKGKEGLNYAKNKRKLDNKVIKKYKLGFAPAGYHNLEKFLIKKNFEKNELIEFGLLVKKNNKIYDKFRERLMHPIFNLKGEVIGFSGRIIKKNAYGPKYLNSPETIIYKKKYELYGAFQAKKTMREKKFVIIVEGNIDILSSAKIGIDNIVCPLGTALTPQQINLLKRYVDILYFCFDTDQAGKKALLRSLQLAEDNDIQTKAIDIENFQDADQLITSDEKKWIKNINNAMEIPEFIIKTYKSDFDLRKSDDKVKYIQKVLPFIAKLKNSIKIDHYLKTLEQITNTDYKVLSNNLDEINSDISKPHKPKAIKKNINIKQNNPHTIKINQSLANLINYIYILQSQLNQQDIDKLQSIYKNNLPDQETKLLDLAFIKDLKIDKTNKLQQSFTEILKQGKIKNNMIGSNIFEELNKMIKRYVKMRLKFFLKILKKSNPQDTKQNTTKRIMKYTNLISQLDE